MIDGGTDVNHPDPKDNIWTNSGEVPGNRLDDDGNGYVDDVNGYDFANDDASVYDPDPISGNGDEHGTHVAGTHVAGTIAAVGNNGVGITGVNREAQVASLKFLAADGGYTSDAIEAINYAVAEGMPISNNSWGGGRPEPGPRRRYTARRQRGPHLNRRGRQRRSGRRGGR